MKPILNMAVFVLLTAALFYVSCKKEFSYENCRQTNKLPNAIAGRDIIIVLPVDSTSLDGNVSSDPDGTITGFQWTKISGPPSFTINNATAAKTVVKNLAAGIYQFELMVTDNCGLFVKDTMQVIVNSFEATNHPPVANAGVEKIITLPINSTNLDGSGSTDPENNLTGYAWTNISGPSSFNIANPGAVQTQISNLALGIYQFELKVTDAGGLFSKDTVLVIVNASPVQPPDVNAGGDIIITLPLDSVFLGANSSSMPPSVFQWTEISGPSVATIIHSTVYAGTTLAKGLIPGLYTFRVEVSNGAGISADTMNVLVINDPQELNTITFKNLKWRLADEYGTSIIDLDITTPGQPNLFIAWDQLRPVEIYLQLDSASQWFMLPSVQSGFSYVYDAASPVIWIARIPRDDTWVGKESSIKIKLL